MRRKLPKRKLSKLGNPLRGTVAIVLLVGVILLGSILLTGGIFPKEEPEIPENPIFAVIDEENLPLPNEEKSLQLQTLPFKECGQTITIDLLLDHTGSMGDTTPTGDRKINRLKEAVLALTQQLSDQSVIGIQAFNSEEISEEVPISFYADVKDLIPNRINALDAEGTTPTHDALMFSYEKLREAIPQFPERQFNFVIVTDGQPVPDEQDPRLFNPNPADLIKGLGVNVYALAIYDGDGQAGDPYLAGLMKSIASSPENYLEARSADDAVNLLNSVTQRICG